MLCQLKTGVHRVCVQELSPSKTTFIQKVVGGKFTEFTSFDFHLSKTTKFKIVFLKADKNGVLRIVGVLLDNIDVFNWLAPNEGEPPKQPIDVGLEKKFLLEFKVGTGTGAFFNIQKSFADGERIRRPSSLDLARRYEYSEFYRPTVSMLGLCEISVPVPFWQKRWKSHERLLMKYKNLFMADGKIDIPKLTYTIIGMFGWRSKYTSDKQDMLLQQLLVDYRGDCEDQALEQAKVIRSILELSGGDSWLRGSKTAQFIHNNVMDLYLVSGAANPCLAGNVIGHCWLSVQLKDEADPALFGLDGGKTVGRLAYIEGTTPVSWGWTMQPGANMFPEFNGVKVRVAQKREYQKLHYLFNEKGRWTVNNGSEPFKFVMSNATKDEKFSSIFMSHLKAINLNFSEEKLSQKLRRDWRLHYQYLVQFQNFHLQAPDSREQRLVKYKEPDYSKQHIVIDRSDHLLGPLWTTADTVAQEEKAGHGSLN